MNRTAKPRAARRWLAGTLAATLTAGALLPPAALAQNAPRARSNQAVTLNFVNAEIEAVTRAMAAILNQQFIVDPRVKGSMTLYSDVPLQPRQAYLNYLAALRGLGFTVVEVAGLYKVVPEADAKLQTGTVSIGDTGRRGDQILTQVFKLNHESANNLVPVLRPLISPNNTINANPGNNSLVITDYADNLQRIAKIIAAMDTPASGGIEVITLQHAVASDIAVLVQRATDGAATAAAPGIPGIAGAGSSVLVDARSNSLLVRAPNPVRMAAIRDLIDKLDRPASPAGASGNVWVVYLKNADAVKLASVLRAAYGGGGGSTGTGTSGTTPLTPTATTTTQFGGGGSAQATAPLASSTGPSTGGFVQADPSTNSLIITAPEPLYRQLRAVIDQLDSRRAQVYIESLIVEVNPSQAVDFGIQWQALSNPNSTYIGGLGTNFSSDAAGSILRNQGATTAIGALAGLGAGGNIGIIRNIGGTTGFGLAAIARALDVNKDANILSTPNLVTLDNEEARIVVGQNVPFITGQFTSTGTATTNPFQTIERKDVGTTLKIRPQIGENGTVRMTIYQESSTIGDVATGTANAGPTTNKRSIESTVVVDDGQIIVLGGLIEDSYKTNRSKVPLLGDIPYFGALFRSESRERKRSNLMVFLRPVVMRDQASSNRISLDRYDYMRSLQIDAQPPQSRILQINESPVLPRIEPDAVGPTGVPRLLSDTPPALPVAPSVPASGPGPQVPASKTN